MSARVRRAGGFTRWWVWLYTLGLAPEPREERRAELASDLWEQGAAARAAGVPEARTAPVILARCLLGIPSDLTWRVERSRASGLPGALLGTALAMLRLGERIAGWIGRRGLPGLTVLLAGLFGLVGAVVIVTIPVNVAQGGGGSIIALASIDGFHPTFGLAAYHSDGAEATAAGLFVFGLVCLGAAAALLLGSRRLGARPWLGAGLIFAGAGLMGLVFWATVVAPLATLLVAWSALRRARAGRRAEPLEG